MLTWPSKDPDERLDFHVNWADTDEPVLEEGETITLSDWTVATGTVVIDAEDLDASGLTKVWLTGGVLGEVAELLNRITTSEGRIYDQSCRLRIKKH